MTSNSHSGADFRSETESTLHRVTYTQSLDVSYMKISIESAIDNSGIIAVAWSKSYASIYVLRRSNRSVSASVLLTAMLKPSRKSKCYISTDAWTRQRHKAESGIDRFYKYKATFLATMEQRAEIAISLYKQFYTFAQLLGVLLANPRIPVSPTRKISGT